MNDSRQQSPSSVPDRVAAIVLGLTFGALFLTLMVKIVFAPINGGIIAGWSLRSFGLLMSGAIGLIGFSPIVGEWRIWRALRALGSRCPACGYYDRVSSHGECPKCAHPCDARRSHWRTDSIDPLFGYLFMGIAGAIASLGIFMLAESGHDGGGGSRLAYVALGLGGDRLQLRYWRAWSWRGNVAPTHSSIGILGTRERVDCLQLQRWKALLLTLVVDCL